MMRTTASGAASRKVTRSSWIINTPLRRNHIRFELRVGRDLAGAASDIEATSGELRKHRVETRPKDLDRSEPTRFGPERAQRAGENRSLIIPRDAQHVVPSSHRPGQ